MSRAHVLIAEADAAFAHELAEALAPYGIATTRVPGGAAAIEHLERAFANEAAMPTLIVCDALIPRLSGLELLTYVAARRSVAGAITMSTPHVLLLSSCAEPWVQQIAMRLGAFGVLRKPFDSSDFITVVTGVLGLSPFELQDSVSVAARPTH